MMREKFEIVTALNTYAALKALSNNRGNKRANPP
jgi:hypothetical protein